MKELLCITELNGMALPLSLNLKKRTYLVEVTMHEEAELNSLDAFVSLALTTFYLLSPDGMSINFGV